MAAFDFLDVSSSSDRFELDLNTKRMGLLEDDPAQTLLIQKYLKEILGQNIELISCQTKEQALVEFLGQKLDFVILDINLPEPQGFAIGKVLRAFTDFSLPIIYTTSRKEYLKEFCLTGQQDIYFLPKPFSLGQIKLVIESIYGNQV